MVVCNVHQMFFSDKISMDYIEVWHVTLTTA